MRKLLAASVISRLLIGLVALLALGGAGPCAEDETQVATPASVNDDDNTEVNVALDSDSDGTPDDANQDGVPDTMGRVTKKKLLECGVSLAMGAAGGWIGIAVAGFRCLGLL